jgi:hypothetical protein
MYRGYFAGNKRHGRGMMNFSNGWIFEGNFVGDSPDGLGEWKIDEHKIFKGYYKDGKRHGQCFVDFQEFGKGDLIYIDDKINGRGQYTDEIGTVYKGDFKNDQKSGSKCLESYPNGEYYFGDFRIGKREGFGTLYAKNKVKKYEGSWVDGQKCGNGIEVFSNGNLFYGRFMDDKKNGVGTVFNSEKRKIFKGFYKNGAKHGAGVLWDDSGYSILASEWLNGVEIGQRMPYDEPDLKNVGTKKLKI